LLVGHAILPWFYACGKSGFLPLGTLRHPPRS
jgi:hypothetical protein